MSVAVAGLLCVGTATYARADLGSPDPNTTCGASQSSLSFGAQCVRPPGPSAPTQPSYDHPWAVTGCQPYTEVVWATGTAAVGGPSGGYVLTPTGQHVPVLRSDPRDDYGWVWNIRCGTGLIPTYVGWTTAARTPNPCSPGRPWSQCRPGVSIPAFRAAAQGRVPLERVIAVPVSGVVGVATRVRLFPEPKVQYAQINVTVPDLGDKDSTELLHVVWIVTATPQMTEWSWPDGTRSLASEWIPQTDEAGGVIAAVVTYRVIAAGYWSDGVVLHRLPSLEVGTISVEAVLRPYDVQQVQPVAP